MHRQRISVAMCTYNGAEYLQEQLDSIAFQTRPPDELVICDDKSSDSTIEIVNKFAAKVPFPVRLIINQENLGSTKNFEKAIGLCNGDIVALSDQDDVWYPEKLMRIKNVLSASPCIGAVFTDAEVVNESLFPLGYRLWDSIGFTRKEQKKVMKGNTVQVLLKHNVVTGATMAFRIEFRDLILPIPDIWVHDGWIALIIAFLADLAIIDEPLIKYRQHSKNQIGATKKGLIQQIVAAKQINNLKMSISLYKSAYNHVLKKINNITPLSNLYQLEEKIDHLNKRYYISNQKLKGFPLALKEIIKLRYHRYSNGWKSVAKDLLI